MAYINGNKVFTVVRTETLNAEANPTTQATETLRKITIDGVTYELKNGLEPSGTDTSTNILAFTEDKGIYIGTDTGHWYYWNGTQYTDGGVYVSSVVNGETIDALSEQFEIIQNKNLTISLNLVDGFVNYTNGNISDNSYGGLYKRTDYISIQALKYLLSIVTNCVTEGVGGFAFFDKDKVFISGTTNTTIESIPSNAQYIVLTDYNVRAVHTGKTLSFSYNSACFDDIDTLIGNSVNNALNNRVNGGTHETPELVDGFANKNNGDVSNNSYGGLYNRTGYLSVPDATFSITHNFRAQDVGGWAFYDRDKVFISESGGSETTITNIPANAKYIVLTDYASNRNHTGRYIDFNQLGVCSADISNLKFVSYGDSIVAQNKWQPYLVGKYGFSHTKLGVGSSPVAYHEATESQYPCLINATRIQEVKDANPDIIVIMGGTNDAHYQISIGTNAEFSKALNSKDTTTFKGAYSYLIETLLTWKPTLTIILMTPMSSQYHATYDYSAYAEAVRDVAHYYSLSIADTNRESGISAFDYTTYTSDGLHPNEAGGKKIANIVAQKLNMIYYIK